jgi:hypothetical protein
MNELTEREALLLKALKIYLHGYSVLAVALSTINSIIGQVSDHYNIKNANDENLDDSMIAVQKELETEFGIKFTEIGKEYESNSIQ